MVNLLVWNTRRKDENTKYTHWESRQNQLRFFNTRRGLTDYKEDGLSDLKISN